MRPHKLHAIAASFVVTLALALSPGARAAAAPRQALSVHLSNQWVLDDGIRLSGRSSDLLSGELRYGGQLLSRGRLGLWLEGDWSFADRNATIGSGTSSSFASALFVQQLHLATRLVVEARPWLLPQVRLGVGAAIGRARFGEPTQSGDSWAGAFSGVLTVGLEALIPRPWMNKAGEKGVTAGLLVEAGYLVASPMSFRAEPAPPGDTLVIPRSGAPLGQLDLGGPVFRIGASLRF